MILDYFFFPLPSYLLPDKNRSSKQKTPVVKRTCNPVWNYTFVYDDVSLNELSERALELTIWDHDRLASNEFLGGVRFSLGTGKFYLELECNIFSAKNYCQNEFYQRHIITCTCLESF